MNSGQFTDSLYLLFAVSYPLFAAFLVGEVRFELTDFLIPNQGPFQLGHSPSKPSKQLTAYSRQLKNCLLLAVCCPLYMVDPAGLEPATPAFSERRSTLELRVQSPILPSLKEFLDKWVVDEASITMRCNVSNYHPLDISNQRPIRGIDSRSQIICSVACKNFKLGCSLFAVKPFANDFFLAVNW